MSLKDHCVFYNPTCTDDCVYCGDEAGLYDRMAKYNQYWCQKKKRMVQPPTKLEMNIKSARFCTDHCSETLINRREQEAPQTPVPTEELMRRLEELMLGYAFDNISGEIKLHSSYSHVADITIKLGPTAHRPRRQVCNWCLQHVTMVGDMVDDDKLYCPNCKKHTESHYNDEV